MKYGDIIQGKNLYLRDIELSDCCEKYINWLKDPIVNQFSGWRDSTHTIESQKLYVSDALESKDAYMFAIIHKENQEHIGNVKMYSIHPIHNNAEISIMIGEKKYWGNGLEAFFLLLKFGFEILNLHKIYGGTFSSNNRGQKLLDYLKFKREGCIRDAIFYNDKYIDIYMYGMLKAEFMEFYGKVNL